MIVPRALGSFAKPHVTWVLSICAHFPLPGPVSRPHIPTCHSFPQKRILFQRHVWALFGHMSRPGKFSCAGMCGQNSFTCLVQENPGTIPCVQVWSRFVVGRLASSGSNFPGPVSGVVGGRKAAPIFLARAVLPFSQNKNPLPEAHVKKPCHMSASAQGKKSSSWCTCEESM